MTDLTNTQYGRYKTNSQYVKFNFTYRIHHSSQKFYYTLVSGTILSLLVVFFQQDHAGQLIFCGAN